MEAVKAIGEGSRRPQTAYRHHWVLTGLANKLFLKALWVGVDRGAEALDNWGLGYVLSGLQLRVCMRGCTETPLVGVGMVTLDWGLER